MPRAFVALLLDDPTRSAVSAEIERLRPLSSAVAWVPAANLHLTLKFLGEQTEARLAETVEALEEAVRGTPPFTIALHGVGGFPGLARPRILWVGLAEGGVEALQRLQSRIEAALLARGFDADTRPWHAHLTIGRVFDDRRWQRDAGRLEESLARLARSGFGHLAVTRIALMRSDLSPRGARYSELRSVELPAG